MLDSGYVYSSVTVTVKRYVDRSVDGAGEGAAEGAAVGVRSTVAIDCTETTKLSPELSKLSCRAEVKLEALRELVTELRAVVLPSSVELTRAAAGAVTTMLTATPESSLRRPATTSLDFATAAEEAAAEEVAEAVRTGSPT